MFKITYATRTGRQGVKKFATLDAARRCASAIFDATGIVVAIEEV